MVAIKNRRKILFSGFLLLTQMSQALAEMLQKGKTRVKSVFNFYHQNSDDGQQVFDNSGREEANVFEPMIFIEHQITEETALTGHFVFDIWTAASDTKLDAQTGASGPGKKGQTRIAGNLGVKREVGKWKYSALLGFSSEYDYKSLNAAFSVSRSFAKDNFTLGLGVQYYKDKLGLFPDLNPATTAMIDQEKDRTILATSLTASQILSRRDILLLGVDYIQAKKNLESTASSVLVANTREAEQLPDKRDRYALTSRWVHGLGKTSALNLAYRYYWDDWDLKAQTLRLAWLFEVNDNEDFIELFGRFHDQDEVKYYQRSFPQVTDFMTSDSDLSEFQSFEFGIYHTLTLGEIGELKMFSMNFENVNWSNGLVYSKRDIDMRYAYWQSALNVEF